MAEDEAVKVLQMFSAISDEAARYLLSVTTELGRAIELLRKTSYFSKTEVNNTIVDLLVNRGEDETFVFDLLHERKSQACASAALVPEDSYSAVIGLLDQRLGVMSRLQRAQREGNPLRETASIASVPVFVAKELISSAPIYDQQKVTSCAAVLRFIDEHFSRGARAGLLEVLVALW